MRPILTPFLALYWTTTFGVGAVACAVGGHEGAAHVTQAVGLPEVFSSAGTLGATVQALCLAVCSGLFFWAFLQILLDGRRVADHGEAVLRLAFGAAIATSCVTVVVGAPGGTHQALASPTLVVAALAASYMAIAGERWTATAFATSREMAGRSEARARAAEAAGLALLPPASAWNIPGGWERPT